MHRRDFLKRTLALTSALALARSTPADALAESGIDPRGLTGHLVRRGDPEYPEASIVRNTDVATNPAAILFCQSARDVATAVDWVRDSNVPFRIRGGRHCYEGFSSLDDGLVIDIRDLRHLRYHTSTGTVSVGAGMSLAKLYEALWKHGRTVPGGSCPTVGVAGHALGGGYGLLARHLGLACDSIREVEIVTADGKVIRANDHRHADLFWACRGGGGGSFGVVTSFVFQTHPIDTVSIFSLDWNWTDFDRVLDAWQIWAPSVDPRLSSILVLKSYGNGVLNAIGQFAGPVDELRREFGPILASAPPAATTIETLSFMDAMLSFSGQRPGRDRWQLHWTAENSHFKNTSDYADGLLDVDARRTLRHALETAPGHACLVQLEAYGGAINNVPVDATAFPHRSSTLFNLQYQAYWAKSQDRAPFVDWVNGLRRSMRPYVSGRAYSNYCDTGIVDWPQAYYGTNLPRLIDVKRRYDPHNLFRFPQSIPV